MKTKIFIVLIALISATNLGIASFPVQKQEATKTNVTVSADQNVTSVESTKVVQTKKEVAAEYVSPAAGGEKSQLIALLLVIFVGGLGIHRFYLGYTWQGVVQLLTLGGCGIWALIDLIRIITGDLKPKNGEYKDKL